MTFPDGITIAGQPILVDANGEAQTWLDRFMPEATVFRPPQVVTDTYLSGLKGSGEFFKSSLLPLPPIKIGQIQWPCVGVSRYARALFLVDRISLFEILKAAWGGTIPTTYPYPIPESWSQVKNKSVPVVLIKLVPAENPDDPPIVPEFSLYLYVLQPIRISDDLWILPLVDGRYFRLTDCKPNSEIHSSKPTATWKDLFDGYSEEPIDYNCDVEWSEEETINVALGHPDSIFANPQIPTPLAIDAACFSVGCRPVVPYPTIAEVDFDFPHESSLRVQCQTTSEAEPLNTTMLANSKITGGSSGRSRRPRSLNVSTRLSREFFRGTNETYSYKKNLSTDPRNGIDLFCRAVWNTLDDQTSQINTTVPNATKSAFEAYVTYIVGKLNAWNVDEYYCVFPDLIKIEPTGFDDYIIYESSGDKKTTTVRSLPIDFVSHFLLAQAPSGDEFDGTVSQVKWFSTNNQTVVGTIKFGAGSAFESDGFRTGNKTRVLIHHPDLVKFVSITPILNRAEVWAVLTEKTRTYAAGDLVHLVWVDDFYTGTDGLVSHWAIDWGDCPSG